MRFFKSRKRVIVSVTLLIFAMALLWFYEALFGSTTEALRRAENFLFSRMTVAQLGEQGTMRYFFVTNRELNEGEGPLEERFSATRSENLKFGLFDTRVEPSIGLGMLVNTSEWFQNEEIRVKNQEALEQHAFVEQLREQVNRSPRRSLLIVINGFRERFPSALRKTAFVGHILDINSPVMVFDWPGNQGSTPAGYLRARGIATESGAELARTIELIVSEVAPERLWLMANSMGAQVVVHAFHELYNNPAFSDANIEFEDVILTAPDVSHEEFDNRFKREIASMTRNLTVYVSSNDRALVMSRIVNRGDARRGESTLSPDMFAEANRVADLVDPDSELITLVDVTPVNRTRNFHNFSLETPEFFDDVFLRLTNKDTPLSRSLYRLETTDGKQYWVISPGR